MPTSVKLTADMQRVLNEQRLGFVASVCEDGTPNLSPKGTTTVWDDEHIVFERPDDVLVDPHVGSLVMRGTGHAAKSTREAERNNGR